MTNYLRQILTYFRNLTLNSAGVSRDLYQLIQDRDISRALSMMQDRDDEVDQAIKEYNPQTHLVMRRPNKFRKGDDPYITEKLPRSRQRYINEVELFFLLGNDIIWSKKEGDDDAYKLFTDFLSEQHFNSRIRQAKRLAGAETESAMLLHIDRNDDTNEKQAKLVVLARSTGYRLRPLFDQYGNLTAFAYGYVTKERGQSIQHWDFQTPKILAYCRKGALGWETEIYPNPTGKINVIYFQQPKAWDGVEPRIHREEMLDSKTGDTNNYFSDPIATATADVIDAMVDPAKPGKLIQLAGPKSSFSYVNPPQSSQTRADEKRELANSILFDTFTPDFDVEKMRGFGTLSGTAIRNSFILGYIKRENRLETYDELVGRFRNVVLATLAFFHPEKKIAIEQLVVGYEFAEPFTDDKTQRWGGITSLYAGGLVSLETAVTMLALTDAPQEEIEKLQAQAELTDLRAGVESGDDDGEIESPTPPAGSEPQPPQQNNEPKEEDNE